MMWVGRQGLKLPCPTLENKRWGKNSKNCSSVEKISMFYAEK